MPAASSDLLTIGRFSRQCGLSVKALRHYDELQLLSPAWTDPETGYRYYRADQVAAARSIHVLRTLEMPLEDIRSVLRSTDRTFTRKALDAYRRRVEERIAKGRQMLVALQALVDGKGEPKLYEVASRRCGEQRVLCVDVPAAPGDRGKAFADAFHRLYTHLFRMGLAPIAPSLLRLESPDRSADIEVCLPVPDDVAAPEGMRVLQLPSGEFATTLHVGGYETISEAYEALGEWMRREGRAPEGDCREVFVVSLAQAREPAELRTEVLWRLAPTV